MTPSVQESHARRKAFHAKIAARANSLGMTRVSRPVTPAAAASEFYAAAHDLLSGLPPIPNAHGMRQIQNLVCSHLCVEKTDLLSSRRHRRNVIARQVGIYLCRHYTTQSLPQIGRFFGKRDHSTALYAVSRIDELLSTPIGSSIGRSWGAGDCDYVRRVVPELIMILEERL